MGRSRRGSIECGVLIGLDPPQTTHRVPFTMLTRTARVRKLATSQMHTVAKMGGKMKCQISVLRPFLGPSLTGPAKEDAYFKGLQAGHLHSHVSSLGVLGGRHELSKGTE